MKRQLIEFVEVIVAEKKAICGFHFKLNFRIVDVRFYYASESAGGLLKNMDWWDVIVVQWVKLLPATPASHMGTDAGFSAFNSVPSHVLRKAAAEGLSTWVPSVHVGDPDGLLGSCLWPVPALATVGHIGSELVRETSLPLLFLCNSAFQTNK